MALSKEQIFTSDKSEEVFEPQESGDLTVNQNNIAHILSRLTDMYSDPILAAARETISNALDATMKMPADQRQPVDVSVGSFDTTFTVRDYGIGMTLEDVKTNFLRYGSSTKSDEFDAVGSYGLGSKSPLAYTSEFTVTTTRDGVSTAFKMSNTSAGFKYDILYNRETGRDSGTVVAIPMRPQDTNRFLSIAQNYQKYAFDLPIIVNSEKAKATDFVELGTVVLDEDSNTVGRVWMDVNGNSHSYYRQESLPELNPSGFSFVLSGYVYGLPGRGRGYYGRNDNSVIVELKPALVDFTSSRDDIAETPRSEALVSHVSDKITSPEFWLEATERIFESDLVSFEKKFSWLRYADEELQEKIKNPLAQKLRHMISNKPQDSFMFTYDWTRSTVNPRLELPYRGTGNKDLRISEVISEFTKWSQASQLIDVYERGTLRDSAPIVISGVDEDNVRKVLGARSKFVRALIEDSKITRFGAVLVRNRTITADEAELETLMGVKYYTADDVLKIAAAATPPKPKPVDYQPFRVEKFTLDSEMSIAYLEDLEEFADEEPVIVLSTATSVSRDLHGYLENHELIESDKPVYVFDEMQLRIYSAIKDTATFYKHTNFEPNVRAKTVREDLGELKSITTERRTTHLKDKSEDELLKIAFVQYAGRWNSREDALERVLTAILERPVKIDFNTDWRKYAMEPSEAAHKELVTRLGATASKRLAETESSIRMLIRVAEENPEDTDLKPLVQVAIDLPNGL